MNWIEPLIAMLLFGGRRASAASAPLDLSRRAEPPPRPQPRPRPSAPVPASRPSPAAAPAPVLIPAGAPPPGPRVAPWPQIVPGDLPPFPGPGWVADSPPGPGVVARAQALLPQLWQGGAGTFKIEQTSGRWIAYRATQMGAKRGVVAFRESAPSGATSAASPAFLPVSAPAAPAPSGTVPVTSSSPVALPTLRRGSKGPDVVHLQQRLTAKGFSPGAHDGDFGPATDRAVRSFQAARGLVVDGIVGPKTWGALY
jgi:hypothetical protein